MRTYKMCVSAPSCEVCTCVLGVEKPRTKLHLLNDLAAGPIPVETSTNQTAIPRWKEKKKVGSFLALCNLVDW